jgi:hypothetical protein
LGAQWQVLAQAKQHQTVHDFDTQTMAVGATWRGLTIRPHWQALGIHWWESAVSLTHWRLGGRAYESNLQAWAATWSKDHDVAGMKWRFGYEGGLGQFSYPHNSVYDSRRFDARLRAQIRWQALSAEQQIMVSGGPLWDEDLHNRPGGARLGHTFNAQWAMNWGGKDYFVVYLQQQTTHEQLAYNPIFFGDVKRSPIYENWGMRYQHATERGHMFYVQRLLQKTKDNIDIFSYKNQIFSIGYQWSF